MDGGNLKVTELVGEKQFRDGKFDRASIKADARTVELAFSSEAPYERWFGTEILSHEKSAVNLERIGSGRANLLMNHDARDYIGVIESARIDGDKIGRAIVRFGNSPRAQEVFKDVQDGILSSVSVGYAIDEVKLTKEVKDKDGTDEYTVTRWTPFEVSLVTVPADHSVGVGRANEQQNEVLQPAKATMKGVLKMDDVKKVERSAEGNDVQVIDRQPGAVDLEKSRVNAIDNLCKMNNLGAEFRNMWVSQGLSVEQVTDDLLRLLEERGRDNPQPASKLGLTSKETREFSLTRAIYASVEKDWSKAGFELECSRSVAKALNKPVNPNTFYVPFEVLKRENGAPMRRDLTVATAGAGGYLVGTDNQGFIEMLRNRSVAFRMGVRRLSGLTGNVTIPRQSAAGTGYWLATEATSITESQQTFVQVALTPKTVGAYTEVSHQLLLQSSPGAEGIVSDDLAKVVALAVDQAVINGSGASGQPTGIINTAGIGSVSGTSLAYAGVLEFQTDVAGSNVMPMQGGYVTTPAVAALMMARQRFSSTDTPLWSGNIWDGMMSGFPAMSSLQIPSANMLFGDWQETVVAEWGVLEVVVNPYANFQAGIVGVRALYSVDVGVRRPFAYSLATTIT